MIAVVLFASGYVVAATEQTRQEDGWRRAIDALVERHGGIFVRLDPDDLDGFRAAVAAAAPRYVAVVLRPLEARRELLADLWWTFSALDDDPYVDVLWGVITGYEAADAQRVAQFAGPLELRRALYGCARSDIPFESGAAFDEATAGRAWQKEPGGPTQ
jgi:zinc protease